MTRVSYSTRTFILGPDDTRYRPASATFSRIVDDPQSYRLGRFAGQRVCPTPITLPAAAR